MKTLLTGLVVFGAIASGVWFHHVQTRTAPSISVWLVDDSGSGGGPGVPAIDGFISGNSGLDGFYTHIATYKVVANPSGKFFVLAHYHVVHLGISTEYDLALPVYEKKPYAAQWAKLDSHLTAVAYMDGGTINY